MATEKRLIDANALMGAFRRYMAERYAREKCISEENCKACDRPCLWRRVVMDAPTVDAVEVVRCEDCKHWWKGNETCKHPKCCEAWMCVMQAPKDHFCSYGERKYNGEK